MSTNLSFEHSSSAPAESGPSTPQPPPTPSPVTTSPNPEPEEEDPVKRAEKVKEQGNVAFKAAKYAVAVVLYTEAIGTSCIDFMSLKLTIAAELNPLEPSYLTNRAASNMALKRFRLALEDCQLAASLQSAAPSPKTLLRLARCQLALGSSTPALSTIGTVLALEPQNAQAVQLKDKVTALEGHVRNFESARRRKDWAMARLALDKCLQSIEGEGGDVPTEWRIWRVELELSRGSWDAANTAAKYVHAVQ